MQLWGYSNFAHIPFRCVSRAGIIIFSLNDAAEKKQKREQHHDVSQVGLGVNAYPGVYGAPPVSTVKLIRKCVSASTFLFFLPSICAK